MNEDAGGCCELLSQLQEGKAGGATKCLPKKVPTGAAHATR